MATPYTHSPIQTVRYIPVLYLRETCTAVKALDLNISQKVQIFKFKILFQDSCCFLKYKRFVFWALASNSLVGFCLCREIGIRHNICHEFYFISVGVFFIFLSQNVFQLAIQVQKRTLSLFLSRWPLYYSG